MATRTHSFTHADGTVSTCKDKRPFTHAVESVTDHHGEARDAQARAEEARTDLESFDRAVEAAPAENPDRESTDLHQGHTRHNYFATDPRTGKRHCIGTEIRDTDGNAPTDEAAWMKDANAAQIRKHREDVIQQTEHLAAQKLAGPRYGYRIIRWSQSEPAAMTSMLTTPPSHHTYNLVELTPAAEPDAPGVTREEIATALRRAIHPNPKLIAVEGPEAAALFAQDHRWEIDSLMSLLESKGLARS